MNVNKAELVNFGAEFISSNLELDEAQTVHNLEVSKLNVTNSDISKVTLFPELVTQDEPKSAGETSLAPRVRKERRPYSPDLSPTNKRASLSKKRHWKRKQETEKEKEPELPFCCDHCGSNSIVDPARVHKAKPSKRPTPRHRVDPITNQVLTLCNACGIAMDRPHSFRKKDDIPSKADKEQYLIEAMTFAASVAEELCEADASKLFCPAYKLKPCGCVQRFITGGDAGDFPSADALRRAKDLLVLHREAKKLKSRISTDSNDKGDKRLLRMMRAEGFERFILANRLQVRQEMGICERACQRLLFYSNNFLHKDLKTGPEKGPRIKRMGGKKLPRLALRPISELPKEACCPDRCVRIALTHNKLLESWRKTSQSNQQGVRKVVADMLTPSGAKSNCHKFIALVTGCSFSIISKVKEQLRRTRGLRDPPEHGMRRWWREHPKRKKGNSSLTDQSAGSSTSVAMLVSEDQEEDPCGTTMQYEVATLNGSSHQEFQRPQEVHEVQFQLDHSAFSQFLQSRAEFWHPLGLDCHNQTLSAVSPASQVVSVPANGESPPQSQTLTVLGPAATSPASYAAANPHPSVIISVPEALQGQAISVITSPTGLEPLSSTPYGNVVILPESAIFVPGPSITDSVQLSGQNITVSNNMEL